MSEQRRRWCLTTWSYRGWTRPAARSSIATVSERPGIGSLRSVLIQKVFSPYADVSLCEVAGLAETLPSLTVSGPFLIDAPGFQVPSDSVFPSQPRSSSRALPLHLHFHSCSDVFSFTSSFVPEPFQPSPSHNRRYRFHP